MELVVVVVALRCARANGYRPRRRVRVLGDRHRLPALSGEQQFIGRYTFMLDSRMVGTSGRCGSTESASAWVIAQVSMTASGAGADLG